MAGLTLSINTDNADFDDNLLEAVADALTTTASRIREARYEKTLDGFEGFIRDRNGNTVGEFIFRSDPVEESDLEHMKQTIQAELDRIDWASTSLSADTHADNALRDCDDDGNIQNLRDRLDDTEWHEIRDFARDYASEKEEEAARDEPDSPSF